MQTVAEIPQVRDCRVTTDTLVEIGGHPRVATSVGTSGKRASS
jgi:hypothetical protein